MAATMTKRFIRGAALVAAACLALPPAMAQQAVSGLYSSPPSLLTSGTATSLSAGQLIASSTTAASIVVPYFSLPNAGGGAIVPKLLLWTSATSGWSGLSVQIDTWASAPTFTNGDGGTYAVATGSAAYLGSYNCTFGGVQGSANLGQAGDGAYAECVPSSGVVNVPRLPGSAASTSPVYWSMVSLSTATKTAGATFIVRPAAAIN